MIVLMQLFSDGRSYLKSKPKYAQVFLQYQSKKKFSKKLNLKLYNTCTTIK